MKKEVDYQGQCFSQTNIQSHPEQLFLQPHMQQNCDNHMNISGGQPQPWSINQEPLFLVHPTQYTSFYNTRAPSSSHHQHLRINISDNTFVGQYPNGLQPEFCGKLSAQEIMEAKALAASKSHSEAERRRRERINNHLAKLRTLLPNTTKTDKASLLAEVIQHVKELKRQTSLIPETSELPSESDELKVDGNDDENGIFVIKASLCCEDRSDLLHDLIKTLKDLRFRTLKAEITTLGGRMKNVLFITEDHDIGEQHYACINSIHAALKGVMEKSTTAGGGRELASGNVKRQRRIRDYGLPQLN